MVEAKTSKQIRILLMLSLRSMRSGNFFYVPDLGILYLATALKSVWGDKIKVEVLANNLRIPEADFARFLVTHNFDIVGLRVFSATLIGAQRTADIVRRYLPRAAIIAGGPHVSVMPQEVLDQLGIDYAIQGDAEEGLVRFTELYMQQALRPENFTSIPGFIWRQADAIHTNERAVLADLDRFGIPEWAFMEPGSFPRFWTRFCRAYPAAPILLTRGCPSRCTFCSEAGIQFRMRSLNKVMEEIETLKERHKVKELQILDDNCAFNREYLLGFCRELIRRNIHLSWRIVGGVCINSLDEELCSFLRQSGCYEVWVGIESGSERILHHMRKALSVPKIFDTVSMLKRHGIQVGGWFILGYPGETDYDRKLTLELALSLPLDYAKFTIFIPQPGSEMFKRLLDDGSITDVDKVLFCSDNQFENNLTNLTPRQLREIHRTFSLRFYARPRIMAHILNQYNSIEKIIYLLRSARQFIFSREPPW